MQIVKGNRIAFDSADNRVRGTVTYVGSYYFYLTLETTFTTCATWKPGESKMFTFNSITNLKQLKPKP